MSSANLDVTWSGSDEIIVHNTEPTHVFLAIAYTAYAVTLQNQHERKLRHREAKKRGHPASK